MPRLRAEERERAIGMLQTGSSIREVATAFGCHRMTIVRLQRRLQQTGTTRDRPRSGRPRVTTAQEDRYLRQLHLRNRFQTSTATASTALGRQISPQTVRRRLQEHGLRPFRPLRGMQLTRQHRQNRVAWARNVRRWQNRNWQRVLFTDESRFQLHVADGRRRVYRRRGEREARCCVQEVIPFGGGGIMVWGGIRGNVTTNLVVIDGNLTAQRYINTVLQPEVIPFLQRHPNTLFQQDNARPHVARQTLNFLNANNVNVLPWPSRSPDINPIEHLWDYLDRQIRLRPQQPHTRQQLSAALLEEWRRIPPAFIRRLTFSMRRRVQACLNANGGHTRY